MTPHTINLSKHEAVDASIEWSGQDLRIDEQSSIGALLVAGGRDPGHLDSILSEQEHADGKHMYVCVSRSRAATLALVEL